MSRVAVLGAGVIGLSTAVLTQRRLPWLHVTLIAEHLSPDTTGDGSAGLWEPYLLGDTPKEDVMRWAGNTYSMLRELWSSSQAGEAGVSLVPMVWLTEDKMEEPPEWNSLVLGFNLLSREQLNQLEQEQSRKYNFGFTCLTFTCEPTRFLPFLMKQFLQLGGVLQPRKVDSLDDVAAEGFDVIVNCTGLMARQLADDSSVIPVRGQVMRVSAPWIRHVVVDDSELGNYIIPNFNSVVLGGTHQEGSWSTQVCPQDRACIQSGCQQMLQNLHGAEKLRDWVGLRPGRARVRLERVAVQGREGVHYQVVHNYGHGGSGVTLSWGCAQDAVHLVQQAVAHIPPRTKL